jgi:TolB-like protein
MESTGSAAGSSVTGLELRLLGPLRLSRGGVTAQLPPSRKVRLLIAYLALAPHPVSRERLCELLWQVPSDPRGELRWCLTKLRRLLDEPGRHRVITEEGRVFLDLADCDVDALTVLAAAQQGVSRLSDDELASLSAAFAGDLLDGLDFDGSPDLHHWLTARRSEFRSLKAGIIAEIGRRSALGTPEGLVAARTWVENVPLDAEAHLRFLAELVNRRLVDEAGRHVVAAAQSFAAEGVDFTPVRAAWAAMRSAPAVPVAAPIMQGLPDTAGPSASRRVSIAVMPFTELGRDKAVHSELGNALTHDIISRLARLRSMFVIARGSVFAIAGEGLDGRAIGERLAVDYVATGYLERHADGAVVAVEVAEAATSRILWTDRFETGAAVHLPVLDHVCDGIVSSIAAEIETAERNRAILKPSESLDAWECYHRGLWHMYSFTTEENARAASFFRQSIRLDPTFSRSWAALSFTHWQSAFQRWDDRDGETKQALETAGRSLLADSHNPAAHWAMGRALWLSGDADEAARALDQSVQLSPNFALGHYAVSFVHSQSGDPETAIASSDHSRVLSPCDPLLFGMLGTRALALVRLGRFEEAADWAMKAASRPNAHVHILAIAAHCLSLAGRIQDAKVHVARIRRRSPHYDVTQFLDTFRFDGDTRSLYKSAARPIGLAP